MKRSRHPGRAVLLALCMFPVIAVCAWQIMPSGNNDAATALVTRSDIQSSVTALGTLQPRSYVDVGSQATGQIMKIHAQLKAGTALLGITGRKGRVGGLLSQT